jgi:multisubunit Na+/H+ antiporter MnhC subunit
MALGAPSLVVLGLLTICSAIYLAMTRGDWEMYVIALGIAMVAQGLLIVLSIRGHHSTSNPMKSS